MKLFDLTVDVGLKIFRCCYSGWILVSFLISIFWSDNIASLYVDAPLGLRLFPKFFLSLAYLVLFIPVLFVVIGCGIVTIIFVAHNCRNKDSR